MRVGEVALLRREVARLEAVVAELTTAPAAPPSPDDGRVARLEAELADALRRAADASAAADAAQAAGPASPDPGDALSRAVQERDGLAAQVAERDQKISRLQREVADKTDRLGRLAKEMGELKAKGLGKLFR
jgi:chromosome segregation ATPase